MPETAELNETDELNAVADPIISRFPATAQELLATRKLKNTRSLADNVEERVLKYWEDTEFRRLLLTATNDEAVEGSVTIDRVVAAMMLRTMAKKDNDEIVGSAPLDLIVKKLGVALRRFAATSRPEKRELLA